MHNVYIRTYGCSLNQSDSEAMAGILAASGRYRIVDSEEAADVVIINSCTVKKDAEKKFIRDIERIRKPKVLAGCVPQGEKDRERFSGYAIAGTSQIESIAEIADSAISGTPLVQTGRKKKDILLPVIRKNPIIGIVPVSEGCLGSCLYCKTKHARGTLISYPEKDILSRIRQALGEGAREIWLTSQDMGCYGMDTGSGLPGLIRKILSFEEDFFLRIGMANPNHILSCLDELIDVYRHPKVFKFLHVPVQSGSDRLLKLMGREYTAADFRRIVSAFRKRIPEITLATDIICGLPTETRAEYYESLELVKEARPDALNISRYWARPGTPAESMPQVVGWEIQKRSAEMRRVFENISLGNNRRWLGWKGEVIIDDRGKNGTWIGRNYAYKQVLLRGKHYIGQKTQVEVLSVGVHDLRDF